MAGTQGDSLPSLNSRMPCTGMNAWRASVASGFWVEKKSGASTTMYIIASTTALTSASRWRRNRHHTSFQLEATAMRSSTTAPSAGTGAAADT